LLHCGRFRLALDRPLVMGIVNVTPDSFSDGGAFLDPARAIAHAERLIEEGADLIDIGGESTRPGAEAVNAAEEWRRIRPVLGALREAPVPVAVDTLKPEVMRSAIDAGASMINDVNALRAAGALQAVAASGAAVCLMHMLGEPRTMQIAPCYDDVVAVVGAFLRERIAAAESGGIARGRIVADPGFGFGKDPRAQSRIAAAAPRVRRTRRAAPGRTVAQVHARDAHEKRRRRASWRKRGGGFACSRGGG
jgi:dihydropteroate synthase